MQDRQADFKVRGSYAQELRSLIDGLARDLLHFSLPHCAQRITTCGGAAGISVRLVAQKLNLGATPWTLSMRTTTCKPCFRGHSRYEMNTQRNLQAAHEIGDLATVALLKVITVSIEKNLWFLESYLEGITVGLHGRKLPPWNFGVP